MSSARQVGFTLVEIMIVVAIIGILAMICSPAVVRSYQRGQAAAIACDFRTFGTAFEVYAVENGGLPGEMFGPQFMGENEGINAYLDREKFINPGTIEGSYDWDGPDSHPYYGISARNSQVSSNICQQIDNLIDDGNVSTGPVRYMYDGARYVYILEE